MNSSSALKKLNKQHAVFTVFMLAALALSLWHSSFGFGGTDESFYYALAQRLYQGDALFADEWHLSQLSAIFLIPFVSIYEKVVGSAEGIIYTGRIVYVLVHFLMVCYAYKKLKNYGFAAVFACLSYFLFTPNEIVAYYYNTIALDSLVLCGIIMAENREEKFPAAFISGILFSCAVLCSPFLAIAFPAFWIFVIITNRKRERVIYSCREAAYFTIGIMVSAGAFLIFLFSRVGLMDILRNLSFMMQDEEHIRLPFLMEIRRIIYYYTQLDTVPEYFGLTIFLFILLIILMLADRKRQKRKNIYIGICLLLSFYTLIMFGKSITAKFMNIAMMPMAYLGLCSYLLINNKPGRMFVSLYVPGLIYALVLQLSSNQYFFVLSMALSVSGVAGYIFMDILSKENSKETDRSFQLVHKPLIILLIVTVLSVQTYTKLNNCYFEEEKPLTGLKYEITGGPAKNIRTDEEKYKEYMSVLEDLEYYADKEPGKLLVYDRLIWPYLHLDKFECAAYSSWLTGYGNADGIDRVLMYYNVNPDKIPQYVYAVKNNEPGLDERIKELSEKYGYTLTENDISWKLEKNH